MNYVVYPSKITKVTDKAFQARVDDSLIWFPKSIVKAQKRMIDGLEQYRVVIPQWFASENGLLAKAYNGSNVHSIFTTEEEI